MATSFGFFLDPACTTPIVSAVQFIQASSSPVPADRVVYFGSPQVGHYAVMSDGGDIMASISGLAASDVRLALVAADLASRPAGAALSLGQRVDGGMAGVLPVYLRVLDSTHLAGQRPFAISTNTFQEWSV